MAKVVKAIFGATLVLAAVAACNDDPLAADRDKGAFMFTNPSVANVQVSKTTKVTAIVMNKYSAPTGDAVTGEPCDAKITAVTDSTRTAFEEPERFVVTGVSAGNSCLVVSGGGVRDTVSIIILP